MYYIERMFRERAAMCPACGTPFIPNRENQVYCSDRCRAVAKDRRRLQARIEEGDAPPGFCPNFERCFECPYDDCVAEKFAATGDEDLIINGGEKGWL